MHQPSRPSGIAAVGDIPWGSHFCQFYRTKDDLKETLVPYFEAGLRNNEACLWVTSHNLEAHEAEALMIEAVPDFDRFVASGQMQFISMKSWYNLGHKFDPDAVLQGWIDREAQSRANGFAGLRLSGDTAWLERSGWSSFMEYERKVNASFRRYHLVALCTYCMDQFSAEDVIDVCCHHQFALARREGEWELLESSSLKIAKDNLVRVNTELESRVESRTAELSSALRARDEFLAMLGHELRNPLAPIHTAAELIRARTPADSPLAATSAILHRQVAHLTRLVDDLLDVARVTQGQIQLQMHETTLAGILELAIEQSRPMIDQRRHTLSVDFPRDAMWVRADPTRLAQVFGNLLHNAAKYTPDGGSVDVAMRVSGNEVTVTISDTGAGIPAPMLASIFELFAQLPRSLARSDGGLGVGLTLDKRIVEMHGGSIEAHSEGVDMGAQFVVRLALVAPAAAAAPAQPAHSTCVETVSAQRAQSDDMQDEVFSLAS